MSKIESGRYSEMLRRLLGQAGQQDIAGELAPEISPVMVLEAERPEWEYLKGARLMSAAVSIPATAALLGAHRLRNPANSGVVAIFTSISSGSGSVADQFRFTRSDSVVTDLGGGNPPTVSRDTRYTGINQSALISSFDAVGAFTGDVWQIILQPTAGMLEKPVSFVLTPGNMVQVTNFVVNQNFLVNWNWLERRLDQLEVK